MATIRKRTRKNGSNSYQVIVRLQGFPSATASFASKTAAKKWAVRTENEIRENRYFGHRESAKHTLSELIDRYIASELPRKRDQRNQKRQLEVWRAKIGHKKIAEVTPAVVVQVRDDLAAETVRGKKRSGATVNRHLAALSHVFTVGVRDWMWAEQNPVKGVSRLPESKGRVRFLSEPERKALLTACESVHTTLHLIVVLALSTGARRGEIMNLRWPDVDVKRGLAILQDTKNGERRSLPIVGYALDLLKVYRKDSVRRIESDLVFPNPKNPVKPWQFEKLWREARRQSGVEDFRFHDLRHSAASYLAMNGATLPEIAAVLGHKTLAMVQRYAHLSDSHVSGVVERMNNKIFEASE